MGGLSIWHWLIVLVIVVLVFGTKRLGNIGKDLGEAVKGFKKGMQDDDKDKPSAQLPDESRRDTTSSAQRDDSHRQRPHARADAAGARRRRRVERMFDIGFSEIFLIAVVALLVLGPERLPKAARFAGLWVRRARAQWYSVKAELENELADEELKRSLRQTRSDLMEARDSLAQSGADAEAQFEEAHTDVSDALRDAAAGSAAATATPATRISSHPELGCR